MAGKKRIDTITAKEFRALAKGIRPHAPYKSRLESEHAQQLKLKQLAGEVLDFKYEPFRVLIADQRVYTPDFAVLLHDLKIEVHEVKGWHKNMRDSRTRWACAAEALPWFRWCFYAYGAGDGTACELTVYGDRTRTI